MINIAAQFQVQILGLEHFLEENAPVRKETITKITARGLNPDPP